MKTKKIVDMAVIICCIASIICCITSTVASYKSSKYYQKLYNELNQPHKTVVIQTDK